MMRKTRIISLILLLSTVLFFSCSTIPMGMTSSTTPLKGRVIFENSGRSEGEARSLSVLGLWMIGKPDIDLAIENAVRRKNGDALINVRWYEKTSYYLLFSITTVNVVGDVVKFEKEENENESK